MGKNTDPNFDKPCEYDDSGECIHHGSPSASSVFGATDSHGKVLNRVIENLEKAMGLIGQTGIVVLMGKQLIGRTVPLYGQMDEALRTTAEAMVRTHDALTALKTPAEPTPAQLIDDAELS